jgi:hypothetical protein
MEKSTGVHELMVGVAQQNRQFGPEINELLK